jgi:hypothetical protein
LLALVALCIVHRFEPSWLAGNIVDFARQKQTSAERISRLATACIDAFEQAVALATRRGRPPRDSDKDARDAELEQTRELLAVATHLLSLVPPRLRPFRDAVVGAWQRLRENACMTQQRFCKAIALPQRTLREWMRSQTSRKKRPPHGRYRRDIPLENVERAEDGSASTSHYQGHNMARTQRTWKRSAFR